MTDDQWQDQQQKLHDVQKRRFLRRSKESPTPYELLANMRPLTDRVTQEDVHAQASIKHQLTITLGHVIRDILAPIRLQIPEDASLAEQEMYRLLMGKSVRPYLWQKIQSISISLQDVILHYFLRSEQVYSKVEIDGLLFLVAISPEGRAGSWYINLPFQDGQERRFRVHEAVVIQGMGSDAMEQELSALFALRSQLFRTVKQATAYSHKVIVQIAGLTQLMSEASQDGRLLEHVKHNLNQQVLSLFQSENDLALLDSNTKIESFHLEVHQLEAVNDYIYSELARIIQVPKTKLLGESAGGLNATGAYDYQHYQDYLQSIREQVLYPFLDAMQLAYQVVQPSNINRTKEVLELLAYSHTTLDFLDATTRDQLHARLVALLDL
ncbi:DUF1073 domain-containing protein (plasmid) [Entomospira nematocerorum]|uniref:DUF1073 domain-containing protein n=1 Tax=Entomospira nematocerorum TaxID=2719987 RepID=A0A968GG25_9SPIO|nr:anti-CBASS Acb1 family protein [Entomospira nematocera]NIZ47593.1 DUF1073 domain-containing protein [Entomospira nematocera]WDI34597.1 DUF1073 domain-containing protein [Entomospira nematocera]